MIQNDDHFRRFALALENEIAKYGASGDRYERQKKQIETLLGLELEFRDALIRHPWGNRVYRDFVVYICDRRRNILAARPFFRERQGVFIAQISNALKKRSEKRLYKFHFNFQFVQFVMAARQWHRTTLGNGIVKLFVAIKKIRKEIVEMNMPLAISRARIFFSRTPKSHLQYMDLIQIGCEGLMAAVDKYVPPPGGFTTVFRAVIVGRISGNMISDYSETPIHFYPSDKRKLYQANKLVGRGVGGPDYEWLATEINAKLDGCQQTNSAEVADLMAAASCISSDCATSKDPESPELIERFAAPESSRPDVQVEQKDSLELLGVAIAQLTTFEKKLLRLKGVPTSFVISEVW